MKFDRSAVRVAACVAVLGLCHAARAVTFFDNTSSPVGGNDLVSPAQYVASSFIASTSATSLTAELLLRQMTAGANTLRLFSDTAGGIVPDAPIATLTTASAATASNSLVSFTGSGLSLTAGTRYWLVLSSTGGVQWNYSASLTPRNRWAIYDVPNAGYSATGDANPYLMRVTDTIALPTVTLSASDGVGQSSFATGVNWSNGQAPSAGNAYVVGNGRTLRASPGGGLQTFAGASLTVGDNGPTPSVLDLGSTGPGVTVNNLTLDHGIVRATAPTIGLGSNSITLAAGGGTLEASGGSDNTLFVSAIGGTGPLTITGGGTVGLSFANTYTGPTFVKSGGLNSSNAAATGALLNTTAYVDLSDGARLGLGGGGTTPAVVKAILTAGYAQPQKFSTGQLRASTLTAGRTIGYANYGGFIVVRATLPGDADLDTDVDFDDFALLQSGFGQAGLDFGRGNFDYNGVIDFNDFALLQANFGQSLSGARVAFTRDELAAVTAFGLANAVPEPSVAVFALAGIGLLRRRR